MLTTKATYREAFLDIIRKVLSASPLPDGARNKILGRSKRKHKVCESIANAELTIVALRDVEMESTPSTDKCCRDAGEKQSPRSASIRLCNPAHVANA